MQNVPRKVVAYPVKEAEVPSDRWAALAGHTRWSLDIHIHLASVALAVRDPSASGDGAHGRTWCVLDPAKTAVSGMSSSGTVQVVARHRRYQ